MVKEVHSVSLIIFGNLSFTLVRGQKIGFNSCECIKFLNIANIHAFDQEWPIFLFHAPIFSTINSDVPHKLRFLSVF